MTKTERIKALLEGKKLDTPAMNLWKHFPPYDEDPRELVKKIIQFQDRFQWDFVKVTYQGLYSIQDWGSSIKWPVRDNVWPETCSSVGVVTDFGIKQDEDWTKLVEGADIIGRSNLIIDDTPGISIAEMRSKCRKYKLEHNLGIIMIDYLQLMSGSGKSDSRQQEISDISRSLKALARELSVPVIALSQLSRAVEQRPDHRPMLSDLRESGAIEQDADVVMFLYRDDYYHKDTEKKDIAEVIIAKQRNGPIGTIELVWLPRYTQFVNMKK